MVFAENMAVLKPADRIIVALDVNTTKEALSVVDELDGVVSFFKVGLQLFFRTHFDVVKELHRRGKQIFLDLKLEDIPTTIQLALQDHPDVESIELMTLNGASQIVSAAKLNGSSRPKFLLLTVLSSLDDNDMRELYGQQATIDSVVRFRTAKAIEAQCNGVIASGDTVKKIRSEWFPDQELLIVTPGIRLKGHARNDHKRTLTPYEAIRDGADYIVVGRPITQAENRRATAEQIIEEIAGARHDLEHHE